jgi:hypothetical protein
MPAWTITDWILRCSDEANRLKPVPSFPLEISRSILCAVQLYGAGVVWKRYLYYQGEPIGGGE